MCITEGAYPVDHANIFIVPCEHLNDTCRDVHHIFKYPFASPVMWDNTRQNVRHILKYPFVSMVMLDIHLTFIYIPRRTSQIEVSICKYGYVRHSYTFILRTFVQCVLRHFTSILLILISLSGN